MPHNTDITFQAVPPEIHVERIRNGKGPCYPWDGCFICKRAKRKTIR